MQRRIKLRVPKQDKADPRGALTNQCAVANADEECKKRAKRGIGMKITNVRRKADNQRDQSERSCREETEKNSIGDNVPGVYFTGEPASSRAVLSERKMVRIFIRERKTNTKRGKYIFHMQIFGEKERGNAPERFWKDTHWSR